MSRKNINELTNLNYEYATKNGGVSTICLATTPHNRTGILKQTGAVLDVEHDDLRTFLATALLKSCGIPCADVDLYIDDAGKHYWLSYDVLEQNQEHIELIYSGNILDSVDKEEVFNYYFKHILSSIIVLPGITLEQYNLIKKSILEHYFINIIIGNYDDKSDNMKIIYDKDSKQYMPPIGYDYGTSFAPDSLINNGIFGQLLPNEVMYFLIKNHYDDLKEVIDRVTQNLTSEKVIELLSDEVYEPLNQMAMYNFIKAKMIMVNNTLESLEKTNMYENSSKVV
ncbi:MAG: hypothetical protein IJZ77_00735 [Bacilli bacterium]|nr:hypothetical protein [Bacilli bacterium]